MRAGSSAHREPFEPFFLQADKGERFCIFHAAGGRPHGAVLYLHPFADEMNKSRRMAALQSRSFSQHGYAVLQIDLFGCGDSSGEFSEATWQTWQHDVALGVKWLRERGHENVTLWGLRLGALLALDAAHLCDPEPRVFVLWQPVLSGEALLTQFLRLRLASEMLAEGKSMSGVQELRASLSAGVATEVAGYLLTRSLASAIDGLRLERLEPTGKIVHWFEVVPEPERPAPPAARRIIDAWMRNGVEVSTRCVVGQPFWNTLEIAESPALLTATTEALVERQS